MQALSDPKKIRPARFAQKDGFYTDDPVELAKQIAGFFAKAERADIDGTIAALVCPHAGYAYSGAVAAAVRRVVTFRETSSIAYPPISIMLCVSVSFSLFRGGWAELFRSSVRRIRFMMAASVAPARIASRSETSAGKKRQVFNEPSAVTRTRLHPEQK
jgi:hypothetical protein